MPRDEDLFHVRVSAEDADRVLGLPAEHPEIDYGCRPAARPARGGAEMDVFIPQSKIDELNRDPALTLEVVRNASADGRERQLEVGEGDRFEGGSIAPLGMGAEVR